MALVGAPISAVELTIFPSITLANLVMAALLFRSIAE